MLPRLLLYFSAALAVATMMGMYSAYLIHVGRAQCEAFKTAAAQDAKRLQDSVDRAMLEADELRKRSRQKARVIREVTVTHDAECKSLPADFRRLFDTGADEDSAPAAVGDGTAAGVADAKR